MRAGYVLFISFPNLPLDLFNSAVNLFGLQLKKTALRSFLNRRIQIQFDFRIREYNRRYIAAFDDNTAVFPDSALLLYHGVAHLGDLRDVHYGFVNFRGLYQARYVFPVQ